MSSPVIEHYSKAIADFLSDDEINEVCINSFNEIWIERNGLLSRSDAAFSSEDELNEFIRQIAHSLDQEAHAVKSPILDGRLPDGTRVNAVMKPIAVHGSTMCLRPFRTKQFTYEDLIEIGTIPKEITSVFEEVFGRGDNVIISGATGSGKTSFLRSMTKFFRPDERVLVVEDTSENIVPNHNHVVSFEAARRMNEADIAADVSMGRLIRNALRQRPDRIVVGEIRTPEAAAAYLEATNTGHTGCLSTAHANSCEDTIRRIANLKLEALPGALYDQAIADVQSNTQCVVHIGKFPDGVSYKRRISEIKFYTRETCKSVCNFDVCKQEFVLALD